MAGDDFLAFSRDPASNSQQTGGFGNRGGFGGHKQRRTWNDNNRQQQWPNHQQAYGHNNGSDARGNQHGNYRTQHQNAAQPFHHNQRGRGGGGRGNNNRNFEGGGRFRGGGGGGSRGRPGFGFGGGGGDNRGKHEEVFDVMRYVHPSMLENPWQEFENAARAQKPVTREAEDQMPIDEQSAADGESPHDASSED